jgi:hypothetical protein
MFSVYPLPEIDLYLSLFWFRARALVFAAYIDDLDRQHMHVYMSITLH